MKPVTVAAIEADFQYVTVDADGTEHDHLDFTFSRETWGQIRQGYACLRCFEPQPKCAYALGPQDQEAHLPGCQYQGDGIRQRQRQDIAAEFYGEKWVGPKKRLDETLAEDDERRAKYQQDTGTQASPLVLPTVPDWVKL